MPDFSWRAVSVSGKRVSGRFSAPASTAVMSHLRELGFTPLEIWQEGTVESGGWLEGGAHDQAPRLHWLRFRSRNHEQAVNQKDIQALTSELAIMLRAGLALDSSLRLLMEMSHKTSVATLLKEVLEAIKGGAPLSKALHQTEAPFGDFYLNMVRSGEASGQLSSVLARLVEHLERQRALRESVISATLYPAILLVVAVLSVIGMLGFVVPQFEKMFLDLGDALPLPTRIIMNIGHIFSKHGIVILFVSSVLGVSATTWLKKPAGRFWWQARVLQIPLLGKLALKYQLTMFSRSLGTLLGSGVPMLTALSIATETVSNPILQRALSGAPSAVKSGGKITEALRSTKIFEPLAINLIRVGEETGRLGPMMLELATILNREVETGIKRVLTLVEPILILILGILIAAIITSILMGILSINDLAT